MYRHCFSITFAALATAAAACGQHFGDIGVGRSASGQLKVKPFNADQPSFDPNVGEGLLTYYPASNSYRTTDPGFDASFPSDADQDYFPLATGASIRLVATSNLTPAFRVVYQSGTIRNAGDSLPLGSATLHRHVVFIVDANESAFEPLRTTWLGTFLLRDTGSTGYQDSAVFALRMSIVDCDVGDVDADGDIDFFDIDPFVAVLSDPAAASTVQRCASDADRDGDVDFFDIDPFVAMLGGA
jgi:hypothetical protein